MSRAERDVQVRNRLGMHARAAVRFVQSANGFKSEVKVIKDGTEANGKSIMGLLLLGAAQGSLITLTADGPDEQEALEALTRLVERGFDEMSCA